MPFGSFAYCGAALSASSFGQNRSVGTVIHCGRDSVGATGRSQRRDPRGSPDRASAVPLCGQIIIGAARWPLRGRGTVPAVQGVRASPIHTVRGIHWSRRLHPFSTLSGGCMCCVRVAVAALPRQRPPSWSALRPDGRGHPLPPPSLLLEGPCTLIPPRRRF